MIIEIHLLSQSKSIVKNNVINAYTKDGLYCLLFDDRVEKYPVCNIFRIIERDK